MTTIRRVATLIACMLLGALGAFSARAIWPSYFERTVTIQCENLDTTFALVEEWEIDTFRATVLCGLSEEPTACLNRRLADLMEARPVPSVNIERAPEGG